MPVPPSAGCLWPGPPVKKGMETQRQGKWEGLGQAPPPGLGGSPEHRCLHRWEREKNLPGAGKTPGSPSSSRGWHVALYAYSVCSRHLIPHTCQPSPPSPPPPPMFSSLKAQLWRPPLPLQRCGGPHAWGCPFSTLVTPSSPPPPSDHGHGQQGGKKKQRNQNRDIKTRRATTINI